MSFKNILEAACYESIGDKKNVGEFYLGVARSPTGTYGDIETFVWWKNPKDGKILNIAMIPGDHSKDFDRLNTEKEVESWLSDESDARWDKIKKEYFGGKSDDEIADLGRANLKALRDSFDTQGKVKKLGESSFKKMCEEILEPGKDTLKKKFKETFEYAYFATADNKKELDALFKHVEDDCKEPRGRTWDMEAVKQAYNKRLKEL